MAGADAGNCDGPSAITDGGQRGFVRPDDGHHHCSIGAYEAGASAPQTCVGDCNGDGKVTVDELGKGVNIALGALSLNECHSFDFDGNGKVTVDELVKAVNNALIGCS